MLLTKLTLEELKDLARRRGIKGYSAYRRKDELVAFLRSRRKSPTRKSPGRKKRKSPRKKSPARKRAPSKGKKKKKPTKKRKAKLTPVAAAKKKKKVTRKRKRVEAEEEEEVTVAAPKRKKQKKTTAIISRPSAKAAASRLSAAVRSRGVRRSPETIAEVNRFPFKVDQLTDQGIEQWQRARFADLANMQQGESKELLVNRNAADPVNVDLKDPNSGWYKLTLTFDDLKFFDDKGVSRPSIVGWYEVPGYAKAHGDLIYFRQGFAMVGDEGRPVYF
jgi:hypothetical protein